ncbi:MAG: ATP-binding protein, partial [Proteocatella sp.]
MELLKISVLNKYEMIEAIQSCIEVIAQQYKMSSKEIFRLNLSVEEAMANVIKYGLTENKDQYFEIAVNVDGSEFNVVISDKGIPGDFILDNYEDKLGVTIMQGSLDRLVIKNLGSQGREQVLTKYL